MKIKSLENISRKDSFIFYRNEYSAEAVFIYGNKATEESVPVSFIVEKTAGGNSVINVKILKHINYPMLGALSQLKKLVHDLEKNGGLP